MESSDMTDIQLDCAECSEADALYKILFRQAWRADFEARLREKSVRSSPSKACKL